VMFIFVSSRACPEYQSIVHFPAGSGHAEMAVTLT